MADSPQRGSQKMGDVKREILTGNRIMACSIIGFFRAASGWSYRGCTLLSEFTEQLLRQGTGAICYQLCSQLSLSSLNAERLFWGKAAEKPTQFLPFPCHPLFQQSCQKCQQGLSASQPPPKKKQVPRRPQHQTVSQQFWPFSSVCTHQRERYRSRQDAPLSAALWQRGYGCQKFKCLKCSSSCQPPFSLEKCLPKRCFNMWLGYLLHTHTPIFRSQHIFTTRFIIIIIQACQKAASFYGRHFHREHCPREHI